MKTVRVFVREAGCDTIRLTNRVVGRKSEGTPPRLTSKSRRRRRRRVNRNKGSCRASDRDRRRCVIANVTRCWVVIDPTVAVVSTTVLCGAAAVVKISRVRIGIVLVSEYVFVRMSTYRHEQSARPGDRRRPRSRVSSTKQTLHACHELRHGLLISSKGRLIRPRCHLNMTTLLKVVKNRT